MRKNWHLFLRQELHDDPSTSPSRYKNRGNFNKIRETPTRESMPDLVDSLRRFYVADSGFEGGYHEILAACFFLEVEIIFTPLHAESHRARFSSNRLNCDIERLALNYLLLRDSIRKQPKVSQK